MSVKARSCGSVRLQPVQAEARRAQCDSNASGLLRVLAHDAVAEGTAVLSNQAYIAPAPWPRNRHMICTVMRPQTPMEGACRYINPSGDRSTQGAVGTLLTPEARRDRVALGWGRRGPGGTLSRAVSGRRTCRTGLAKLAE